MNRIDKLTLEQEAELPLHIKKWLDNTVQPMDHEKADLYVKKMYHLMGKSEPKIIIGQSPFECIYLAWIFLIHKNNQLSILYHYIP